MRDAVGLIGKMVQINELKYKIKELHFLPDPVQPLNYIWFGLKHDGVILNYSYNDLLPYLKEQIKL